MYVTTNSAVVWKRMADENKQSAKLLARTAIGLFVMLALVGGYAFTAHSRYSGLCSTIEYKASIAQSKAIHDLAQSIQQAGYCG